LIYGIVVGAGIVVVIEVFTLVGTVVGIVDVVGVVVEIDVVEFGSAVEITVPFGYWQPHKTNPFGQVPTLWQIALGGHVN